MYFSHLQHFPFSVLGASAHAYKTAMRLSMPHLKLRNKTFYKQVSSLAPRRKSNLSKEKLARLSSSSAQRRRALLHCAHPAGPCSQSTQRHCCTTEVYIKRTRRGGNSPHTTKFCLTSTCTSSATLPLGCLVTVEHSDRPTSACRCLPVATQHASHAGLLDGGRTD